LGRKPKYLKFDFVNYDSIKFRFKIPKIAFLRKTIFFTDGPPLLRRCRELLQISPILSDFAGFCASFKVLEKIAFNSVQETIFVDFIAFIWNFFL